MKMLKFITVIGLSCLCLTHSFGSRAQVSFLRSINKQDLIQTGKEAYNNRCAGCHGVNGDANSPVSKMLNPKPRDFTKGIFKFKSTPIGAMPTNADLMKILNRGIPGSSMPSFALVSQQEKKAIIEYIKTFAPESWKSQSNDLAVARLPLPKGVFTKKAEFLIYAARGRAWFQELGCVACHGTSGKGDGPSAPTLVDTWGNKIIPANLGRVTVKRGATIQDIATSIMMGVDGTPMPAHIDILESLEEQFPEVKQKQFIWDLAAWIFYLRGRENNIYAKDEIKPIPKDGIPSEDVNTVIGKYLNASAE